MTIYNSKNRYISLENQRVDIYNHRTFFKNFWRTTSRISSHRPHTENLISKYLCYISIRNSQNNYISFETQCLEIDYTRISILKECHHRRYSKTLQRSSITKLKLFIFTGNLITKYLCDMSILNFKIIFVSFETRCQEMNVAPAYQFSKIVLKPDFQNINTEPAFLIYYLGIPGTCLQNISVISQY